MLLMKRFLLLFFILILYLAPAGTPAAFGEETAEEPAEEIILAPDVIDRTANPETEADFEFPENAKILDIWFPNVMNADEAILIYEGEAWLIDCGDERMGGRGADLIRRLGITGIAKMINTHPHHDHLNGLKVTDKAAGIGELLFCFDDTNIRHAPSLKNYKNALAYAEKNNIAVASYHEGSVLSMGDGEVTLTCYANTDLPLDVNNRSAQIMLRYGKRTILFMADMEAPGQQAMLERIGADPFRADLLKYPHHGKSAMDDAFLEAVNPEIAIITNKKVEDWKGIKYLKKKQVPYVYTTVYQKKIPLYLHLMTDGEHWILERVPQGDITEAVGR